MEKPNRSIITVEGHGSAYVYHADTMDTYLSSIADVERIKDIVASYEGDDDDINTLTATAISSYIKGNK